MKPSKVIEVLSTLANAREPAMLVGAPGVGKTDMVFTVANNIGAESLLFHPIVSDPTDGKGYPYKDPNKDYAEFAPYGDLLKLMNATSKTVAFIDDFGQALPAVQASFMQLFLAREINGKRISDEVTFIVASNRKTDRAAVSGILEPVKSRMSTIIEVETDLDDWIKWAILNGMPLPLIAFIRFKPNFLSDFTPTSDMTNSPSPRTIATAGRLLKLNLPADTQHEVLQGCVGKGMASELVAFMQIFNKLPNLDNIIANPTTAEVPSNDPSVMYSVAVGLSHKASTTNFDAIMTYANRFQRREYAAVLVKDAITRHAELQNTRAFIDYATRNTDMFT